jgi:tRNA threonylcarbamoyladenosine biosynthesis protein TsaB
MTDIRAKASSGRRDRLPHTIKSSTIARIAMLILALDTSQSPGSIALAHGDSTGAAVRDCGELPRGQSTGRSLAGQVRKLLQSAGAGPRDVGLIAVDIGPGSFTGLRIAVTFAKMFAYATGAGVAGVVSMEVLAEQAAAVLGRPIPRLWTLVDAHRGQVFTTLHEAAPAADGAILSIVRPPQMVSIESWLEEARPGDVVTGPMVERLAPRLAVAVDVVDAAARLPSADTLALLAWRAWRAGRRDDMWELRPFYLRPSAAEERRGEVG